MITLQNGDSESMRTVMQRLMRVTCAYGVRNFEHLEAGLKEMNRVMRAGGKLAILEFSHPKQFPVKQVFGFYFKYVLPFLGRVISRHSTAYTYLPEIW
ncbi:MAG: class I SAM-dependent methyltransferase [Chitinophagaceae bacterium]